MVVGVEVECRSLWRDRNTMSRTQLNIHSPMRIASGRSVRTVADEAGQSVVQGQTRTTRGTFGRRERPTKRGFDHPFKGIVSADRESVTIGQGYVYAGSTAEWDFPWSGQDDEIDLTTTGTWLVYMNIVVKATHGHFSDSTAPQEHPVLRAIAAGSFEDLNTLFQADHIIGTAVVANSKITSWRQRTFQDIYVPVRHITDTAGAAWYYASWQNWYSETVVHDTTGTYMNFPSPATVDETNGGA